MSDQTLDVGPQASASFTDLLEVFQRRGLPHVFDPDRQVIETPVNRPPLEGNLFLRWEKTAPVLQLIVVMIDDLPLKRLHELETACCHANSVIALPGFGIDYTRRALYYRLTLPTVEEIPSVTLDRMILSVVTNARDFLAAFQAVVAGQAGREIVAIAVATKP